MITDTVKVVATTLASVQAAEAEKAHIALEVFAASTKSEVSEVAKKHGISVKEAKEIANEFYKEAEIFMGEYGKDAEVSREKKLEAIRGSLPPSSTTNPAPNEKNVVPSSVPGPGRIPKRDHIRLYESVEGSEREFIEKMMKSGRTREYSQKQFDFVERYMTDSMMQVS